MWSQEVRLKKYLTRGYELINGPSVYVYKFVKWPMHWTVICLYMKFLTILANLLRKALRAGDNKIELVYWSGLEYRCAGWTTYFQLLIVAWIYALWAVNVTGVYSKLSHKYLITLFSILLSFQLVLCHWPSAFCVGVIGAWTPFQPSMICAVKLFKGLSKL